MANTVSFETESCSRVGGREVNEDSFGSEQAGSSLCWVVADGLGGHQGGETASRLAVEAALNSFRSNPELSASAAQHHLEAAQEAILKAQQEQPSLSTMRTTIVLLLTDSRRALWAHVGDSRLYCLENGRVEFCTSDHSVVQMMVKAGELSPERARHHEDRNRLLRCLGSSAEGEFRPTILPEPRTLRRGTSFLLCTDGFWEYVSEQEMEVDFAKTDNTKAWLTLMEARLREHITDKSDNYTAMAMTYNSNSDAAPPKSIVRKRSSTSMARWSTIVFWFLALSALALVMFRAGERFSALQREVGTLVQDNKTLTDELENTQQQARALQTKLDALQKTTHPATGPAAPNTPNKTGTGKQTK